MYNITEYQMQQLLNSNYKREDILNEIKNQHLEYEIECKTCIHDGNQSIYLTGCTGCEKNFKNYKRK